MYFIGWSSLIIEKAYPGFFFPLGGGRGRNNQDDGTGKLGPHYPTPLFMRLNSMYPLEGVGGFIGSTEAINVNRGSRSNKEEGTHKRILVGLEMSEGPNSKKVKRSRPSNKKRKDIIPQVAGGINVAK